MKPKLILCLALALSGGLFGCASNKQTFTVTRQEELPGLIGQHVRLTGIAVHNCPGAMLFGGENSYVFIDGLNYWPTNYDHRQVQVVGVLDEKPEPYLFVIRHATWKLLP